MKQVYRMVMLALLLFSCLACKDDDEGEQMPPYSTSGAGTFAAYVNGQLWLPKGRPTLFQPNFDIVYDPGYQGGNLSITAHREVKESPDSQTPASFEVMILGKLQVNRVGVYTWGDPTLGSVRFWNEDSDERCWYNRGADIYSQGTLEITRLDLEKGIISGTFEFTLARLGCDTLRVTGGRFDKKVF